MQHYHFIIAKSCGLPSTQYSNKTMAILPGSESVWEATFDDILEAMPAQFGFDFYFISLIAAVAILSFAPVTILVNMFTLSAFYKDPNRELHVAPSNVLLMSLALSDLFVGAVQSPLTAYYWLASFISKKTPFSYTIMLSVNAFVSIGPILQLLALSVDRYIAIVFPLRYVSTVTKTRTYIVVVCIWCYSLTAGITSAVLNRIISSGSLLAAHVVIPYAFMMYLNTRVIIVTRRTSREFNDSVINRQTQFFIKRERKIFKLVLIVLSVFTTCYLPWFITIILALSCNTCNSTALVYTYGMAGILLYVSPLVHPFLYTWRLPKFRKALLHFFESRLTNVNSTSQYDSKANTAITDSRDTKVRCITMESLA